MLESAEVKRGKSSEVEVMLGHGRSRRSIECTYMRVFAA
jgi:hypothetical protein